ncbi:hypothetical protein OHA71_49270 [Streptomyces sp. NBC_00444]
MAEHDEPEGHCRCCSRRNRPYQAVRWWGLAYSIYQIVWDIWPF